MDAMELAEALKEGSIVTAKITTVYKVQDAEGNEQLIENETFSKVYRWLTQYYDTVEEVYEYRLTPELADALLQDVSAATEGE